MDVLRLNVVPAPEEAGGGFQVEIFVNAVEMTSAGAGLGMDPYDLLVPTNRFEATEKPVTVPVARCTCGVYGCGSTDVTIVRDGQVVHWDWQIEVPMNRRVTFDLEAYLSEIRRAGSDFSWETLERAAGRFILQSIDHAALAEHDVWVSWLQTKWDDPALFRVALTLSNRYQLFLDVPWLDRSPESMAEAVDRILRRPPQEWPVAWHAMHRADGPPPPIGQGWVREQY